jgi:DNA-binding NarL/FixJ family response regulator
VPALVVLGRAVEARALAEQAYAAHQQLGPQPELADASIHLVGQLFAGREAGPIGEVTGLAEMILGVCVELGSTLGQAYFGVQLGGARLAAGRVRSAAAAFDESAVFMRELAQPGRLSWSLAGAAQAYALAGDIDLAAERLDELATTRSPERLLEGEMQRAHAWCAVGHGMISQARAILRGALDDSRARQTAGVSLWLLHDLARLGSLAPGEEPDAALRDVQGPLAAARRDHVCAVARQDGDALDGAANAFAALGADLLAADAAAQAAGVHHATGHERRAAASRNQALTLAATCEGASTPALATLVTSTLTDREREIAQLAAGGLGNRAIAEQLFVSLRTVENHLQHVYVKLGVDGRHELASVLASVRDLSSAHS